MYHFATILKNASALIANHYPQENLKFIHAIDSYYAPYNLTEGANQTVITDDEENDNLTFKTNGHLEKFIKVQVDDQDLEKNDYDVKSGSTIVTLKDSFLKTLSAGTHTLKMLYIDNEIETTFQIEKVNTPSPGTIPNEIIDNPTTGDKLYLYISLLGLSLLGLSVDIILLRTTKKSNNRKVFTDKI
jgi:hypothetical protein